jgi:protein CpxP
MHKLDLTAEQKQQVATILKDNRDEGRQLFEKLAAAREKLFAAIHEPQYNEETIRQAAQELAPLREDLIVFRARVGNDIRNVLTPEQQEKFAAFRAEMKDRMRDRMEARLDRMDKWIDRLSEGESR